MKKLIITLLVSLAVIVTCVALFFFFTSSIEEKEFSSGVNSGGPKHVSTPESESKIIVEKKRPKPSVKKPPAAVVSNAPVEKNIYEEMNAMNEETGVIDKEIEAVDEEIEAIDEKFTWDSENTAQIVKTILLNTPPQIRKYAFHSFVNSFTDNLKNKENGMVDLEMVYKAIDETVPPDMPEMRDILKNYIDEFFDEEMRPKTSVKKPPAAVVSNAPVEKDIYEEMEVIDEEIEVMDEKIEVTDEEIEAIENNFTWDSENTAQIVKSILLDTPPQIRKYAFESVKNSLSSNLKNKENGMVDLEMVYKAIAEAVPPDMPGMREILKNYYIDDFE